MKKEEFSPLIHKFGEVVRRNDGNLLDLTVKFLNENIPHYNWVGIYMVEGGDLVLKTYSGPKETEHTRIKIGFGICGLAAKEGVTIIVPDVSKDPRYISCFLNTKSEMVVPIFRGPQIIGEIDIDSDFLDPFNDDDKDFISEIINLIGRRL
jgi:L-methionine (R)-S-oxide reductase